jgi:hypothetical protein
MTAEEIRRVSLAEFVSIESAMAYFVREIAAQLAELNAQVGKGRLAPLYVWNPQTQSGLSPIYRCPACSLVFYSDGALKAHFADAHETKR